MREIIFYNIGKVITPLGTLAYGELHESTDQAIRVVGGKIHSQGDSNHILAEHPNVPGIDCEGKTMIPAFVDPHTHPVFWKTRQAEFKMRLQGKDYEEIAEAGGGIRNSVRAFREASYEQILEITRERLEAFYHYGTLTLEAKSGYGLSLEDEIKALEVIKVLSDELPLTIVPTFLGAHEIPDEYRDKPDRYVDIVINEMIPMVAEKKLAKFCDVFCEKNVFSVEQSEKILNAAKEHGLRPKIHADELNPFGGAELAARVGAISADHLIEVSDKGIEDMQKSGVIPVLLPATTFFLRKKKYAPARKMIERGMVVSLSTDCNPGSSFSESLPMIISLAAVQMKLTAAEALSAVTVNAAVAIDRGGKIGQLVAGYQADVVIWDMADYRELPYHYGVNLVSKVVKRGKPVVQRRILGNVS